MFYEERPRFNTIPLLPSSWRNDPKNLLENSALYQSIFASVAMYPTLLCWAELLPLWDAPLLLKGFGFFQLHSILWFWEAAPINISSNIFPHMIFIANYIYEIGNTSNGEWYVRSLLLLGNHFKSMAENCYSVYDSSFNPWALLLKLGNQKHFEMKMNPTCSRERDRIFSNIFNVDALRADWGERTDKTCQNY